MYRIISIAVISIAFFLSAQAISIAGEQQHGHGTDADKCKKGILLVTFGSSYSDARKAFQNIDKQVKKAYPDMPVRWAYTSKMIREKLASRDKHIPSPAQALAEMKDQGFTHVAVQSLHIIQGYEYEDLKSVVEGFGSMHGKMQHIELGDPLLSSPDSLVEVRDSMLDNIPEERKKDEAVIFLGHGTHHPSNAFYQAMSYKFQQKDPLTYIGTIGGSPGLDSILPELEEKGVHKVYLMPFMSVAGDHAKNDMAGEGEDSWKSVLQENGYTVSSVLKGMGEYDNIVDIWMENLQASMQQID